MRIAGTNIPKEKKIQYSLPYVYGIGPSLAKKVLEAAGIDGNIRTGAIDQGVLFTIELTAKEGKDFWVKTYKTLLLTFTFAPPSNTSQTSGTTSGGEASDGNVIFEGEETVE